jgi:hypothetical protein
MLRFVMGAFAALVLLAGQANASAFVPISTGGEPSSPTPANITAFIESLFPGETVTFLAKRNVGGANEQGEGVLDLTFTENFKSGTWTYTPDPGNTLLPNIIVLKAASGDSSVGVYAADPLNHTSSFGNFDVADFPLLTPNGKNLADLSNISALYVTPLAAAVWMFGAAVAGIAGMRRLRKA